jgi:hypothetical protein
MNAETAYYMCKRCWCSGDLRCVLEASWYMSFV